MLSEGQLILNSRIHDRSQLASRTSQGFTFTATTRHRHRHPEGVAHVHSGRVVFFEVKQKG